MKPWVVRIGLAVLSALLTLSLVSCVQTGKNNSVPATSGDSSGTSGKKPAEETQNSEKSSAVRVPEKSSVKPAASGMTSSAGSAISGQVQLVSENSAHEQHELSSWTPIENNTNRIAWSTLPEKEQAVYSTVLNFVESHGTKLSIARLYPAAADDEKMITRVFSCIMADHPELFFLQKISYIVTEQKITVTPAYLYSKEKAEKMSAEIQSAVKALLTSAPVNGTDYEKSKWVYEQIISRTSYLASVPDNQNMYSVFVNRRSVCAGYAAATQYLLQKLNIPSSIVYGQVHLEDGRQVSHAWNCLKLNGSYYFMDTTWGDPSFEGKQEDVISYCYLNLTTVQLLRTHTLSANSYPIPVCTATGDSYFVRERLQFTAYEPDTLRTGIARQLRKNQLRMAVYYTDANAYSNMKRALSNESVISGILCNAFLDAGLDQNQYRASYLCHDRNQILELIITKK